MSDAFRVSVPEELADELVTAGDAVRPLITRGGLLSEFVQVLIDGVNAGSSVITVTGAAAASGRLVQKLVRHLRSRHGSQAVVVDLRGPGGKQSVRIEPSEHVDGAAERLRAAFDAVRIKPERDEAAP